MDHEPKATERGVPPAHWPSSGAIRVENLSARYSERCVLSQWSITIFEIPLADSPEILHDVSFEIKSGERVGVGRLLQFGIKSDSLTMFSSVGRTGAGNYLILLYVICPYSDI